MGATSGWSRGAVGRVHSCLAFRRRRWHRRRKVDYKPYTRESVGQFLTGPESLNRKELIWGIVREPPAPFCDHQSLVTRVLVLLAMHVSAARLGKVLVSPVDVVLDEQKALVLQPDVVFISNERRHIIKDRIWGAPDLTVEVLSPGTRRRDCRDKRRWYREYGVREYWMVDALSESIEVLSFSKPGRTRRRVFRRGRRVVSPLLPGFDSTAAAFFE